MKTVDHYGKIKQFLNQNPNLAHEQIGILLMLDSLYEDIPDDVQTFRRYYSHLDPNVLVNSAEGIVFLKIARNSDSEKKIKDNLNKYLNIKFNDVENKRSYAENMITFKHYSEVASDIVDDVLGMANYPDDMKEVLREVPEVRECYDFYQMFNLFVKSDDNLRIRFEILRKIGFIVLISRINRSIALNELGNKMGDVRKTFKVGLGLMTQDPVKFNYWLDKYGRLSLFEDDEEGAKKAYQEDCEERKHNSLNCYPMQVFDCNNLKTYEGNRVCHIELRNKFVKGERVSYSSYVEKMFRKNLEFPNQVRDVIGVKIVVKEESDIPELVKEIESFLGGSSTRNEEKNSYHKFGKKLLNAYSSDDYYVWKAIYDITLPHPSMGQVSKVLSLVNKDNSEAQEALKERLEFFRNNPRDSIVEVQLQDLRSYLLSIAKGSSTDHDILKMNQIRRNSFFKIFPQEIYQSAVNEFKVDIMNSL